MSKKDLAIMEMKIEKEYVQNGICPSCQLPVYATSGELAHRIPQRRWTLAKWGAKVIHHALNLALTHPGRCNSAVSIGNHPVAMEELAEKIRRVLDDD